MLANRTRVALAISCALFSAAAGAAALPYKPTAMHVAAQPIARDSTSPLIGPDGMANVMIVLKGEPATHAYARALKAGGNGAMATTSANNAARNAIANLKSAQASFVSKLNASGVAYRETYRVQRVLNGIAVRMKPQDMAKVRALPNVERVEFLPVYQRPDNITSVPFVNAPQVWAGATNALNLPFNAKGEGVKIGDIDTGLDYIHPDFGGSGLLADYQDVDTTSNIGKNSHNVIFPTAKVVGGTDFAGDAYDASNDPVPDPNPMDCGGHGSHTAGTLAGVGVNADGTPFAGPYDPIAPYAANLKIGPGVAPAAQLYALRVFGCGGSTSLVTQAIDWATDPNDNGDLSDHLDVINMSLGSPTGVDSAGYNSDIEAVNNATLAGVIVVSAAGNSGDTFFIHGAPGAASVGIGVAASVDNGIPGALLTETAPASTAYPAAAAAYANPSNPQPPAPNNESNTVVKVLDSSGGKSLGCGTFSNAAAISGHFALIDRGTCNFTVKVLNAQAAGALGVIVANNDPSTLVPNVMGGTATSQITIPGISISNASGAAIKSALAGGPVTVTLTATDAGDTIASFSSRGPVSTGDGATELKPDVAAPGLSIPSVQTGLTCTSSSQGCLTPNASGFIPGGQVLTISGTSMATPHVAGMMALLRELHPDASVEELKAMALNGAAHDVTLGANQTPPRFGASRVGAGSIDASLSATSSVIAFNQDSPGAVSVTFDVEPVGQSQASHTVKLENLSDADQTVTLQVDTIEDAPGISFSVPGDQIVVPAHGSTTFDVTMDTDTALMKRKIDPTMGLTQSSAHFGFSLPRHYLAEESALIKIFPQGSENELARLPVYAALRPHSTITTSPDLGSSAPLTGSTGLTLSGQDVCTGTINAGPTCTASLGSDQESFVTPFELQVTGAKDSSLPGFANLHYVGVNSGPDGTDTDYFFGVASYARWGTPTDVAYDVCIDSDNDGKFDKILFNTDLGTLDQLFLVSGANSQDTFVTAVLDNVAGTLGPEFLLNLFQASTLDSGALSNNTMILGAAGADLGLTGTVVKYGIAVCPGFDPLCGAADWPFPGQGTAHCGTPNRALASFHGPYTYDSSKPGVDGAGSVFFEDLNGGTVDVAYDVNNLVANGSNAMLLLHTHNTSATSAQVVVLDRIFANGAESN